MLAKAVTYPSKHEIKYTSPYAHYHYVGILYLAKNGSSWAKKGEKKYKSGKKMKYHISGTGPKWDKRMMNDRGKEVCQDVENFIKRGGK